MTKQQSIDLLKMNLAILKTEIKRLPMKTNEDIKFYERKFNEYLDMDERLWDLEN